MKAGDGIEQNPQTTDWGIDSPRTLAKSVGYGLRLPSIFPRAC